MGAGRKMEIAPLQINPYYQPSCNSNPYSARHLRTNELAGVIFGCKYSTFKECMFKQLFGLPASHIQYVQNITPGMPLFLFNYSDRTLHGVFEATSAGQMYINRYAWTLDGEEITPFPAQVRVKIRTQCYPLKEDQYKIILAENYLKHEPDHLWFELDKVQTRELISLFSASPVSPSVSLPPTAAKWGTLFRQAAGAIAGQVECSYTASSTVTEQGLLCNSVGGVEGEEKSGGLSEQYVANNLENNSISIPEKKWSSLFATQSNLSPSKEPDDSNSERLSTSPSDDNPPISPEATSINREPLVISAMTDVAEVPTLISKATCIAEDMSSEGNIDLLGVVNNLIQALGEIKEMHARQTMKIQTLELELEEANSKLRKSKVHKESVHSGSSPSARYSEEMQLDNHDVYQSILLVGGCDGSSWLQNLDCYCPFEDIMRPLVQMKSVRSYASTIESNGELYVLGGGYDSSWYDTVEAYNLKKKQWVSCPSLNRKKGGLAVLSLLDKIFATGGGDSNDCFSEVEVLDPNVGKWIVTRSMFKKRFAPAAAELNGVLYVGGGFDGHEYLSSVERFDPRAYSWTRLKSMNTRRGCHSMTVLNEKLYAIGGFDGTQMIPSVEVFEPRTGSWSMIQPMTYARGGLGGVNFGDKIYAIGGMQENKDVLDTVEYYSEAEGWKLMQLKSMGRRCFFSAIAV
ncbi:hypothetical protein vseg_002567 [Gypsophila vaccaria]